MTSPIPAGVLDVSHQPVRRPGERGKVGVNWQPGLNQQNPPRDFGPHPGTFAGSITVTVSGPWFGDLSALIRGLLDELTYNVAAQGLSNVQYNLDRSIRHPTPYYETQVRLDRVGTDMVVHDRGIVYGPWLEGVSHRNQTTRFKGYHSFRRATQELERQADSIIGRVAVDYIRRELT